VEQLVRALSAGARDLARAIPIRAPKVWKALASGKFDLGRAILVGAALPASKLLPVAALVVVAFLVMLITRAVPVYGLLGGVDWRAHAIPWRWRHFTFWGGLRGALSVALALSVADIAQVDSRVSVVAYGVVLLSLLVQGGLIAPVARTLRIETAT